MSTEAELLRAPLMRRADILRRPNLVPAEPGLYAWYFAKVPPRVPTGGCHRRGKATLLYLGVSPSRPGTRQNLRRRIRSHLSGNASGSTLRLSLGCLLSECLRIRLTQIGTRLHFGGGESELSQWLDENALVCCVVHSRPWDVERALISRLNLPLNLHHNASHPFAAELSGVRAEARARARLEG